jgi:BirA family biotin operon repressor/biotin-[acetyl-CoA-carboxylase] ligase
MDQQTVQQRLADLPLGEIRYFLSIGSTNDEAADWAARGALDFSLVLADEQTAGRGRGDRKWFTHPGSALAFSLILRPNEAEQRASAEIIQRFTGLGALGVSQTLQNQFGLNSEIKWPNDVLLNRQKVCGILAEAHWIGDQLSAVILGIGINVAPSSVPSDDVLLYPATCLETEFGKRIDRIELLQMVLAEIIHWRVHLMKDVFIQKWELNLAFRGAQVQVTSTGAGPGPNCEGRLLGLNPDGALRLCNPSGETIVLRNGEIPVNGGQIQLRPVDSSSK